MLNFIKGVLHRALSETDLLKASGARLSHPPFPPSQYDTLAEIRATKDGSSLVELWRREYRITLKSISEEQTWKLQRAQVLQQVAETFTWRTLFDASQTAQHESSWLSQVREAFPMLQDKSAETCEFLTAQRWYLASCTGSCLRELGSIFYGLDDIKTLELDFLEAFQRDVRKVQIRVFDYIEDASKIDTSIANELADWHDREVLPIINDEFRLLTSLEDDVVHGSLDLDKAKARIAVLEARKTAAEDVRPVFPDE